MEDNMQQKYEKYMNATKVERIYTRRGDDSIYVDVTISIDARIVDYTLEIEDVWFEGIYNITVDEDGYSFRFRQFGNERDVNKRDIYISDDEMAGYLNVSEGYNESDITSPLIAKLVDDSDYIYNAIIARAI